MKIERAVNFTTIPEWILLADVPDKAIRLYGLLDRHADSDKRCRPSRGRLAKLLRCNVKTIDRSLAELERIGAITKRKRFEKRVNSEKKAQTSNLYVLEVVPKGASQMSLGGDTDVVGPGVTDVAQNESQVELKTPLPPQSGGSKRTQNKNPRALGTAPRQVAAAQRQEQKERIANCQLCDGRTWIVGDGPAEPCPNCRAEEVA